MRIVLKILALIVSLALMAVLFGMLTQFHQIPWASDWVVTQMQSYRWLSLVFSIVLLFFMAVVLFGIILLFSVRSKRKVYTISSQTGRIDISKQGIVSDINHTLEEINGVRRFSASIKGDPRPGRLKVLIEMEPKPGEQLAALSDEIQQRVKNHLSQSLGIEIGNIRVKVNPTTYSMADERHRHPKVPRVV